MKPFTRCAEVDATTICGGDVHMRPSGPGRTRIYQAGDGSLVKALIPENFELATCEKCDESYVDEDACEALDSLFEKEERAKMEDTMMKLAQAGYEAYGDEAQWTSVAGKPMPKWDELPERIRGFWRVAARAIVDGFADNGMSSS